MNLWKHKELTNSQQFIKQEFYKAQFAFIRCKHLIPQGNTKNQNGVTHLCHVACCSLLLHSAACRSNRLAKLPTQFLGPLLKYVCECGSASVWHSSRHRDELKNLDHLMPTKPTWPARLFSVIQCFILHISSKGSLQDFQNRYYTLSYLKGLQNCQRSKCDCKQSSFSNTQYFI